jgi:RNA polymerase-binding transcription factor
MRKKDLEFFKDLLTRRLDDLLDKAYLTIVELRESDDNLKDPLDRAVLASEHNFTFRMRDRERMLINKVKEALEDIENNVYGICEDCGAEISIARLKARPVARRCILCKSEQERIEKVIGA